MTKNVKATVIQTTTFHSKQGFGDASAILIVEPSFEKPDESAFTAYEEDALALSKFLNSIFCTATLDVLKRIL